MFTPCKPLCLLAESPFNTNNCSLNQPNIPVSFLNNDFQLHRACYPISQNMKRCNALFPNYLSYSTLASSLFFSFGFRVHITKQELRIGQETLAFSRESIFGYSPRKGDRAGTHVMLILLFGFGFVFNKMLIAVVILLQFLAGVRHVTAAPLIAESKRFITPNGTEVFDPRPHGYTPVYSPTRWPDTVFITRDGSVSECTEFPDRYGISVEYMYDKSNYTFYCWQNNTMHDPSGRLFLRTVEDCYVDEDNVPAEHIDFQDELPWCGPIKPYLVDNSPLLWNSTWSDTAHYTLPCWREPTTKSQRLETGATYPHMYCWVEGEKFGNST
ncbi:uncharacterized protein BDR25DRAFT_362865 [Lindgomyces ingoldianus]|uniref:Uncharacterized protein n=1 Tax=Lindgomyces ingoldianus TaxID=673940 RepID=A0ACB6Q9Q4_9PLEO|nr:uncharacterized protein BDR25DRAFT_362865 [Lindgomyces ingoldianus]KAF2463313.1 hypothetical protein BDR25DRAFT_362865 [Lindgomyces ingoldianus]